MASKAGAYVLNTFPESLFPYQVLHRNLREYGLNDLKNILWVESEKNISVGIIVSYLNGGGLMDFSFIRALRH
jgi:hypothetical protein